MRQHSYYVCLCSRVRGAYSEILVLFRSDDDAFLFLQPLFGLVLLKTQASYWSATGSKISGKVPQYVRNMSSSKRLSSGTTVIYAVIYVMSDVVVMTQTIEIGAESLGYVL